MRIFINLPINKSAGENSRTLEKLKIIVKEKFGENLIYEYYLAMCAPDGVDRELFIAGKLLIKLARCDYYISLNETDSVSMALLNAALQNGIDCCLVSNKEFYEKFLNEY